MRVSVIGLGKLGLCTAASFASAGIEVIGVDTNEYIVENLKKRACPIDETGLPELLESCWEKIQTTYSIDDAVQNSDIAFIVVPTPSMDNGAFTNKYLEVVLKEIAHSLKNKKEFFVIDVVSTVMPGSSENEFIPLVESISSKKCSKDFGLVYNPEFIALGSVIQNFLNPDMILIGSSDSKSSEMVKNVYEKTCHNTPEFHQMSLINAEITKLSLNCYVTMKISYANELASICEKVQGADVDVISSAVGADSRVGKKYIKGGLGFGGPCFPRDNQAFQTFGASYGVQTKLSPNVISINDGVVARLMHHTNTLPKKAKICILGLSYKPSTYIVEESQSILLIEELLNKGFEVSVHDPMAIQSTKEIFANKINYRYNTTEAAQAADAIFLMTDWDEYKNLNLDALQKVTKKECLFIDAWRQHKNNSAFNYIALGLGK